jgi:hypothetical protein
LGLRALFIKPATDDENPFLEKDFTARLVSPKFTVVPTEYITRKKGSLTPCRWKWAISCSDIGEYHLLLELSDVFRDKIQDDLLEPSIFLRCKSKTERSKP